MSLRNYGDKVHRYARFTSEEWKGFWITVLILAFIFSFTDWGETTFDVREGLANLAESIIIVAVSVFVHHAVQRLVAVWYSFRPEHVLWWQGMSVGLLLAVLSNGVIKFLPGSAVTMHHLPLQRLGTYRYGPNIKILANIAAAGPAANLIFAMLIHGITLLVDASQGSWEKWYSFNLLFGLYNLLPIPPLDGSRVFYGSRLLYAFVFSAFVGYVVLSLALGIESLIGALIIGGIGWLAFYFVFERGWG